MPFRLGLVARLFFCFLSPAACFRVVRFARRRTQSHVALFFSPPCSWVSQETGFSPARSRGKPRPRCCCTVCSCGLRGGCAVGETTRATAPFVATTFGFNTCTNENAFFDSPAAFHYDPFLSVPRGDLPGQTTRHELLPPTRGPPTRGATSTSNQQPTNRCKTHPATPEKSN